MKYSPKKTDTTVRVLYSASFVAGIALMIFPAEGARAAIFSACALILLAIGIFMFVKYDCSIYEYILLERNGTFDFYVNKLTGKRGTYVCYFPLTDCVETGSYKEDTRKKLLDKYPSLRFAKYVQNFISSKNLFYAIFRNDGALECVIFEPNEEFIRLFEEFAGKLADGTSLHHDDEDEEQIEISVDDASESQDSQESK